MVKVPNVSVCHFLSLSHTQSYTHTHRATRTRHTKEQLPRRQQRPPLHCLKVPHTHARACARARVFSSILHSFHIIKVPNITPSLVYTSLHVYTFFNTYTNAYTHYYMFIHVFVHEYCMRRHSDWSTQKCMHLYICTYIRVQAYYTCDAYTYDSFMSRLVEIALDPD